MLLVLLIAFILAHVTPAVPVAVALLSWFEIHWVITILLVVFFA